MYDGPSQSEIERVYAEGEEIGYQKAIADLRDARGYESWCADHGRYDGSRIDFADFLESRLMEEEK